jgi:dethiobiotin synthetase
MAFVGAAEEDSETTICAIGGVRRLGRLPMLKSLDADSLAIAFSENFALEDFE